MVADRLSPLAWTLTPIPMPASLKEHESVGRFWLEGEGGRYRLAPVETLSQDEILEGRYDIGHPPVVCEVKSEQQGPRGR